MGDTELEPLPPGTYLVKPVGRNEHVITLRIMEGEYEGQLLYARLSQLLSTAYEVTTVRSVDGSAAVEDCEPYEEHR